MKTAKTRLAFLALAAGAWMTAPPVRAQQAAQTAPAPADRIQELERRLDVLTQEIERLKLGGAAEPQASVSYQGLAPAAAKVYQAQSNRVSIGGYGEMTYQHFSTRRQNADPSGARNQADFLRAVLYAGYKFNDWILFNSEIEFEHAGSGEAGETRGEISLEQAYIDFRLRDALGVRAGLLLVPMGFINEIHEPTTFHGVLRPNMERVVIPSTWRENGVGVFGKAGPLSYRSYLVAGLHAVATADPTTDGFTGSSALRGGRTGGSKTFADDKAWVTRLDATPLPGLLAGGSLYLGEAGQGLLPASVPVSLWELHAMAEHRGAELRALYAEGRIGNADSIDLAQGFTDAAQNSVGRRVFGGYVEAAFNALSLCSGTEQYLAPFFRYERYDTQAGTPEGFAKNPANSRVDYTAGLTYKPIPQIAVKTDYQWKRNQARTGVNQWNLGLGYIF